MKVSCFKHVRTGEIYRWRGSMVYKLVNRKWRERPELKVADLFHWPYIGVKYDVGEIEKN